jgi:hypothetical protein
MIRLLLAMLLAVQLAACDTPRWVREDASAEQADKDDIECQRAAAREASLRAEGFYGPPYPYRYGPYGRNAVSRPDTGFDPYGYRKLYEARLTDLCMRAKGYVRK